MLPWDTLWGVKKQSTKRKSKHKPKASAQSGRLSWTPRNYQQLSAEGYQKNVIVFRCINLIAKNLAMPPWTLYEGEKEIENHFLINLIEKPNPLQTRTAFLETLASYLLLDGNAYVQVVGEGGMPQELFLLRPDRVQILTGPGGVPRGYVYEVEGKRQQHDIDSETGSCAILHLKLFHPTNDWYGLSPIQAAASAIDQHNAVGDHNLSLLLQGGRPTGAFMLPKDDLRLMDEQREQLMEDLRALYQGVDNTGKILLLEGGLEWREMGLSPKDLDFISGKHVSTREIAQAFGVPSMLVGVPGDSTFSNYREARFHLWEDTVLPLLHMVMEEINRWIVPAYGEQLAFSYDADQIPALGCRRERLWSRIQDSNFLTVNEKRAALGYSPLAGGDSLSDERIQNDTV